MPHSDPVASTCAHYQRFELPLIYPPDGFARHPDAVALRRNSDSCLRAPPIPREHPAIVQTGIPRRLAPVASRHGRGILPAHAAEAALPPPAALAPLYTWPIR